MLDSVYIGLTGLSTFSKGLNNISNNVANLNTPGFKRSQVLFKDLFYNPQNLGDSGAGGNGLPSGNGVDVGSSTVLFKQGELRQSGNDQDAAISGNGLFILRQDGKTFYTRAGQFEFDANGYLISRDTGARVAVLGNGTNLEDFNISGARINPPQITSSVKLSGNLSVNDSDSQHTVANINVFDSNGQNRPLTIKFTNNSNVTPRSWLFQIDDQAGNAVSDHEIQFQGDGSPVSGFETFTFTYTPSGASAQQITLNFGEPGKFSGATNFSAGTESTLSVLSADGYTVGALTKVTFNDEGQIILAYSNGQTSALNKLALAWFNFLPGLDQQGGNLFYNDTNQTAIIGSAKSSVFGRISGGNIESSNVDLTQQFSELIVTQRGYQASSQVLSAANEMMQQLLDLKGRR